MNKKTEERLRTIREKISRFVDDINSEILGEDQISWDLTSNLEETIKEIDGELERGS